MLIVDTGAVTDIDVSAAEELEHELQDLRRGRILFAIAIPTEICVRG